MCSKWVANYWTNHDRLTTSTKGQKVKGSCMINQNETIWFPLPSPQFLTSPSFLSNGTLGKLVKGTYIFVDISLFNNCQTAKSNLCLL